MKCWRRGHQSRWRRFWGFFRDCGLGLLYFSHTKTANVYCDHYRSKEKPPRFLRNETLPMDFLFCTTAPPTGWFLFSCCILRLISAVPADFTSHTLLPPWNGQDFSKWPWMWSQEELVVLGGVTVTAIKQDYDILKIIGKTDISGLKNKILFNGCCSCSPQRVVTQLSWNPEKSAGYMDTNASASSLMLHMRQICHSGSRKDEWPSRGHRVCHPAFQETDIT